MVDANMGLYGTWKFDHEWYQIKQTLVSQCTLLINSDFFMNFTAHSNLYGEKVCSRLLYYTMQKDSQMRNSKPTSQKVFLGK